MGGYHLPDGTADLNNIPFAVSAVNGAAGTVQLADTAAGRDSDGARGCALCFA